MLWILSYLWHAVAIVIFLTCLGVGVFDLTELSTVLGNVLLNLLTALDICMGIYMVIVMSLAFILNDAVPRSLPRAHLRTMRCLTFFVAFMTMLKGRFRKFLTILAAITFVYYVLDPAVLAGSLILLTLMTKTSERSSRMSASSMTVPL